MNFIWTYISKDDDANDHNEGIIQSTVNYVWNMKSVAMKNYIQVWIKLIVNQNNRSNKKTLKSCYKCNSL